MFDLTSSWSEELENEMELETGQIWQKSANQTVCRMGKCTSSHKKNKFMYSNVEVHKDT